MNKLLEIITVTKDDLEGITGTVKSTRTLREEHGVKQFVIDSSGEGTREKVEELASGEQNVEYTWHEPKGIAYAFNRGLIMSNAKWVWCLNGGDRVHYEVDFDKLLYILHASGADAVIFGFERMQSGLKLYHPPMWRLWPPVGLWIHHSATIVHRELFEKYGLFKEEYRIAMDTEAWLRFFSKDVVVDMISIPISVFDEYGISSTQVGPTFREAKRIIKSYSWMLFKGWLLSGKRIYDEWRYYSKNAK
jgi:glycosyltransferase involved in cell wall biosynthesis